MKIKNYMLLIICFLIISCSFNLDSDNINSITNDFSGSNEINKEIIDEEIIDEEIIDEEIIDEEIIDEVTIDEVTIDEVTIDEKIIDEKIIDEEKIEVEKEIVYKEKIEIPKTYSNKKILDIKFYSQFPSHDFGLPFDEFCEESSLLNGIYYLLNKTPTIDEYIIDLNKIKDMENKLFGENGYKNTSIKQTNLILQLFQNPDSFDTYLNAKTEEKREEIMQTITQKTKDKLGVLGKILYKPSIEDLMNSIDQGNPVILPVYGKGLNNIYFTPPGPVYHNILLKGYDLENFIFNEVGTIRGDSYVYNKNLIINNIHDFIKELYPENYLLGDPKVLILYK